MAVIAGLQIRDPALHAQDGFLHPRSGKMEVDVGRTDEADALFRQELTAAFEH
jgi:hypothetical protein